VFHVCYSHEDGSVRFWDVSGGCLRLVYRLDTASLFGVVVVCCMQVFHVCYSHEDGSVRFWDVSGGCLRLVYRLDTASLFGVDTLPHSGSNSADLTDDWPPFRKVISRTAAFHFTRMWQHDVQKYKN